MAEVIAFVTANGQGIIEGLMQVVGGFAALAAFTPNESDNKIFKKVLDALNFLGANFGKAKNK